MPKIHVGKVSHELNLFITQILANCSSTFLNMLKQVKNPNQRYFSAQVWKNWAQMEGKVLFYVCIKPVVQKHRGVLHWTRLPQILFLLVQLLQKRLASPHLSSCTGEKRRTPGLHFLPLKNMPDIGASCQKFPYRQIVSESDVIKEELTKCLVSSKPSSKSKFNLL